MRDPVDLLGVAVARWSCARTGGRCRTTQGSARSGPPRPSGVSRPRKVSISRSISRGGSSVMFWERTSTEPEVRSELPRSRSASAIFAGVIGLEMNASMPACRQASRLKSDECAVVAMMMVLPRRGLDGAVARGDLGADGPRQVPVEERDVVVGVLEPCQGREAVVHDVRLDVELAQHGLHRDHVVIDVLDDKRLERRWCRPSCARACSVRCIVRKGISAQKQEPSPTLESTPTRPPILPARRRQTASPRPVPADVPRAGRLQPVELREEGGELSASVMPRPWSFT